MKANYHTHTQRCFHAIGSDEEYVLSAIKAGYDELGFSDHTPWKYESNFVARMRMPLAEFDNYYESISSLREKYKDQISIKIGLECEYYERYMPWLTQFIEEKKLDYIIFGNHYYETDEHGIYFGYNTNEEKYMKLYVDECIAGMKTGLYAYLAHPDLFMRCCDEFSDFHKEESYRLCKAAKELDVPLEYNLSGVIYNACYGTKNGYPNYDFFKIAAEVGNDVIIGIDAHDNEDIEKKWYREDAIKVLNELGVHRIDSIKFLR